MSRVLGLIDENGYVMIFKVSSVGGHSYFKFFTFHTLSHWLLKFELYDFENVIT